MRSDANHRDGYALIEVMMALVLIAMLAGLALPGIARGTGPATLRVAVFQTSALLREDRNVAIATNRAVTTSIGGGVIRSGATAAVVSAPSGTVLTAPARIVFSPNGRTSGGDIVFASVGTRMMVTVGVDSGAIRVVAP